MNCHCRAEANRHLILNHLSMHLHAAPIVPQQSLGAIDLSGLQPAAQEFNQLHFIYLPQSRALFKML